VWPGLESTGKQVFLISLPGLQLPGTQT